MMTYIPLTCCGVHHLGGMKCIISSTIASSENHVCPLLLLQSQLSPRNYPFYHYPHLQLHFYGIAKSVTLQKYLNIFIKGKQNVWCWA